MDSEKECHLGYPREHWTRLIFLACMPLPTPLSKEGDGGGHAQVTLLPRDPGLAMKLSPGYEYTKLAYSTNDQRLFPCGTGKDGEPYLVEWEESEEYVKRTYKGFRKTCFSTIQFDSTN